MWWWDSCEPGTLGGRDEIVTSQKLWQKYGEKQVQHARYTLNCFWQFEGSMWVPAVAGLCMPLFGTIVNHLPSYHLALIFTRHQTNLALVFYINNLAHVPTSL